MFISNYFDFVDLRNMQSKTADSNDMEKLKKILEEEKLKKIQVMRNKTLVKLIVLSAIW